MNYSNDFIPMDWYEAICYAMAMLVLVAVCKLLFEYFEYKNEVKLTETERNKRMMDGIYEHCNEYK